MVQITVGEKGRLVIPAAIRSAAGIAVGEQLIARPVAEGQIILETRLAVAGRIKARFAGGDGTAGLRRSRAEDLALDERRRRHKPHAGRDHEAERRRGDEILVALGALGGDARAS